MIRKPVVAGIFYESSPKALRAQVEKLWPHPQPQTHPCLAAVVPHAGYIYSGRVAAGVYARLEPADTYILIGPNHTGRGERLALTAEDAWETPLGRVPMDKKLSQEILKHCEFIREDNLAHREEHSLEVQLPFLQMKGRPFSIVGLLIGTWDMKIIKGLGMAIAEAVGGTKQKVVILASSDMNHFENLEQTRRLDHLALQKVLALDPDGLMEIVSRENISMCGAAPAAAMLTAAREMGARNAAIVDYATSAEAGGDEERVVGYAGVIITP
ncbi:AmmeMemoRadiSam system protein B [bacterium]|nr:AmmeMemoRadiSam system protein B [bacterium]